MSSQVSCRSCSICKKIFCCVECRIRHEENKHSKRQLNCPFCASEKLPFKVFEDKNLLCHVVFNHLPLFCCLCGKIFEKSEDLEKFELCKWWSISTKTKSVLSSVKAGEEGEEVKTPSPVSSGININSKIISQRLSIDGADYNNSSVFISFTSPPEYNRNTSTPMHVDLGHQKPLAFEFKTPSFVALKTPKTTLAASSKSLKPHWPTSLDSKDSNFHEFVSFPSSMESKRNFSQKLDVMTEIDENELSSEARHTDARSTVDPDEDVGRASPNPIKMTHNVQSDDMELTNVNDEYSSHKKDSPDSKNNEAFKTPTTMEKIKMSTLISTTRSIERRSVYTRKCRSTAGLCEDFTTPDSQKIEVLSEKMEKRTDSVKRVRFSDNFDDDTFYEALDTLNEVPMIEMKPQEKLENVEEERGNSEKSTNSQQQQQVGSSRVVMVLVAETTNAASPLEDLKPLISSSLRQLSLDESSIDNKENANSSGIFSSVAQAVRQAFRNLAGGSSPKSLTTQQTVLNTHVSSNSSSTVSRPNNKRSREIETQDVATSSPIAKRPRAWPKIKGRPPISRMRHENPTTSRGVSSDTQVFSRGCLSVGDTVLPIPSRAHKSTQTQ
ncbi:uncharacterized protein fs(1)Ya isoform X2 [Prorops nasuta]|uniref:uncharacterized protein fs(1)Ya isoform X2 n=1 Tax=Prorops nasuta TaxID=863751 RepID=UPI0034CD9F6D